MLDAEALDFIENTTTAFMATASADGQPYVQHRGGPPGFLRVLDDKTIAFADLRGNRQYISVGNLGENQKVHLLLMDYARRQRVKIWGTARIVDDRDLTMELTPPGERAERAIVITVERIDWNCPKGIPQLVPLADVKKALEQRDRRIAELERQLQSR